MSTLSSKKSSHSHDRFQLSKKSKKLLKIVSLQPSPYFQNAYIFIYVILSQNHPRREKNINMFSSTVQKRFVYFKSDLCDVLIPISGIDGPSIFFCRQRDATTLVIGLFGSFFFSTYYFAYGSNVPTQDSLRLIL